jgi:3,4-dihydroxy 2-butanone 4-phosphate synthase/GTP cyclohydrolase II
MRMIGEAERGVVVLLREARATGLSDQVAARLGQPPTERSRASRNLREYGVGAQILLDLGVREMILLSNTKRTIVGLDGFGLTVVEQRPIALEKS